MSALLEHLVRTVPADELVGVAVRHLREPRGEGGDYRGLGPFAWVPAADLPDVVDAYDRRIHDRAVIDLWSWVNGACGGPERAARRRHLHGERVPGALMLRPVFCSAPPAAGGGRLDELGGVVGLPIDVDVSERRPGDRRRYCPTMGAAIGLLELFGASVVLDAGGGAVGVWLFDAPADPHAARRLGRDLVAAIGRACSEHGWRFDSPAPHAAWIKFPGAVDLFRAHETVEVSSGPTWSFAELRRAVPFTTTGAATYWSYHEGVTVS